MVYTLAYYSVVLITTVNEGYILEQSIFNTHGNLHNFLWS